MRRAGWYAFVALCLAAAGCSDSSTSGPSSSVRVTQAGWSFGFCLGPCRGRLELEGNELSYEVSDREGGEILVTNRGQLSDAGDARLDSLASRLPEELQDTYGCPDCADGGASFLTVVRDAESMRVEYEYGNPPDDLSAIDSFLKSVMDALGACRTTADVSPDDGCTPLPD